MKQRKEGKRKKKQSPLKMEERRNKNKSKSKSSMFDISEEPENEIGKLIALTHRWSTWQMISQTSWAVQK